MATGSFIGVTPGAGAKLATGATYTENANVVQDEKVIFGEQYVGSYVLGTTTITPAALGHALQMMAGASLKVRVRRIEVHQSAAATAAAIMELAIIRLTSAGTGGTVQGTSNLDTTDGGSGATAMTLPTVKGAEGALIWWGEAYLIQTVGASTPFVNPIFVVDFDRPRSKPLIIPAGTANGFCVRSTAAHAGATVRINVIFDETSF